MHVINYIYHAPLTISPALGSPSEEMLTFPIFHQFQTAAIKKTHKTPQIHNKEFHIFPEITLSFAFEMGGFP